MPTSDSSNQLHSLRLATPAPVGGAADPLRVVLLEDDPIDAELIKRMLGRAWSTGVEVRHFERLADLEAEIPELGVDLIFCDLSLPDADGIGLVGRLVSIVGPIPVVVLTGSEDPTLPVIALEAGAQDYLVKGGFDVELLTRTLRHSLARSRAEEALRRAAADLQALNGELGETLGIVAHDLRASLRTGRLFAGRLLAAVAAGTEAGPMGELLDSSLDRMEQMLERLLRLANLREGAITPTDEMLSAAVADVEADLTADLDAAGADIRIERDELVRFDPLLFRELLRHLVANSIQYRDPARGLRVVVSARTAGPDTTLSISDNGVGIAPEYRDRVFGLFERLDRAGNGLGFGLACSRRIVELHRGSIELMTPADGLGLETRIVVPAAS